MGAFVCKHICNRGSDSSDALDGLLGRTVIVNSTGLLAKVIASDSSSLPFKVCYYSAVGKAEWVASSGVQFVRPAEVSGLLEKEASDEIRFSKALAQANRRRAEADAAAADYQAKMAAAEELRQKVAKMREDAARAPSSTAPVVHALPASRPWTGTIDLTNRRPGGWQGASLQAPPTDTFALPPKLSVSNSVGSILTPRTDISTSTGQSSGNLLQVDLTSQRQPALPPTKTMQVEPQPALPPTNTMRVDLTSQKQPPPPLFASQRQPAQAPTGYQRQHTAPAKVALTGNRQQVLPPRLGLTSQRQPAQKVPKVALTSQRQQTAPPTTSTTTMDLTAFQSSQHASAFPQAL